MNMVTRLTDRIYDLDMGLAMMLDRDHDKTIRCVETHLWIAEKGWAEDVILSSGECHAPKSSARAAVSALIGRMCVPLRTISGWIARAAKALRTFGMLRGRAACRP